MLTQYYRKYPEKKPTIDGLYIRHFRKGPGAISAYVKKEDNGYTVAFSFCSPGDQFSRTESLRAVERLNSKSGSKLRLSVAATSPDEAIMKAYAELRARNDYPRSFQSWTIHKGTYIAKSGTVFPTLDIHP